MISDIGAGHASVAVWQTRCYVIQLNRVTARIADKTCLTEINLKICTNENWVILGSNGSGKTALGQLLCGQLEILSGTTSLPEDVTSVAFEDVTRILEQERYRDDSNFCGGYDPGTSVRQFIWGKIANQSETKQNFETTFTLSALLDRGIKFLSTGEMRKVLICKALISNPQVLVLDEPFDGLDQASCELLRHLIAAIMKQGILVILLLNRFAEIPSSTTHIAVLQNCHIKLSGPRQKILAHLQSETTGTSTAADIGTSLKPNTLETSNSNQPLIRMADVNVSYRGNRVLNCFNWTVLPGEHWMISGANGSGKTTLLNLITGDNTQAYGNHVELFGRKKGSGESIWDIKQRIGHISTAFQRQYRVGGRVEEVVLSGFYDSIGLYKRPTPQQQKEAQSWLALIQLENKKKSFFQRLSFGEQRLVLLARAMIKQPELLLLDEPCQGLDEKNRRLILQLIDTIAANSRTQILYVTHHPEDKLSCINRHLTFVPRESGGYSAITHRL